MICSDSGKHQGISAVLLSIEVHSQLQTAHNLSCCSHGAVKKKQIGEVRQLQLGKDSLRWRGANANR